MMNVAFKFCYKNAFWKMTNFIENVNGEKTERYFKGFVSEVLIGHNLDHFLYNEQS